MGIGDFQVDWELWANSDSLLFFVLFIVCIHWAMKFTSHWLHLSLLFRVIGDCLTAFLASMILLPVSSPFFVGASFDLVFACVLIHGSVMAILTVVIFIFYATAFSSPFSVLFGFVWSQWLGSDSELLAILANRPLLLLDCLLILINNRCQSLHKSACLFLKTLTWSLASNKP